MSFIFFLFFFLIYCSSKNIKEDKNKTFIDKRFNNLLFNLNNRIKDSCHFKNNNTNKNNNTYIINQNSMNNDKNMRNLQENPQKLRIYIDSTKLETYFDTVYDEGEFKIVNNSIYKAKETLEELIKVKTPSESFEISESKNSLKTNKYLLQYSGQIYADLAIFFREKVGGDGFPTNDDFAKPIIITRNNYNRVIVGLVIFNFDSYDNLPDNETYKSEILNLHFLHQFTHLLGFDKDSLENKGIIKKISVKNRIIGQSDIIKYVAISSKVLDIARNYYNCPQMSYVEFNRETNYEDLPNSHWEGRLLLGDYMTTRIYYPEQVISEFTLALLDDLGWYEITYYTGGLMRFGKNKGCEFLDQDCINKEEGNLISSFKNEFCSYDSFGSCSSGRQSRTYCINFMNIDQETYPEYQRNIPNIKYGLEFVEYCPVSYDSKSSQNSYFIGNCKIGNDQYGNLLKDLNSYNEYSEIFGE